MEVDGALVDYDPNGSFLLFADPSKEGDANDFFKTFKYEEMRQRGNFC